MAGSSLIGNLAVTLGLNTAAFSAGATKAEMRAKTLQGRMTGVGKSIGGIGASIGIGLGIGALASFTKNAFDMAAALSESAQKMGVSVESLQELNLAAEQSGVSQETLAASVAKLNRSLGDLQLGKKGAVDAFDAIGLSAEDLKGKSPDQALRLIADALNKLPDVQQRVAIGAQLMGRGFSQLLPLINEGSAGLDKYAEASRKNGQITTEDAKRLDELSDRWDKLKTRAGVATANLIVGADKMVTNVWGARDKVLAGLDGMITGFWSLRDRAIAAMGAMVTGIATAITGKLNAIWEGAKANIDSVKNKFKDMYDAVVGHSYVPDMIEGIGKSMAELQRIFVDPAATATEKVGASFQVLAGLIGDLFGQKAGGIIGSLGNLAMALAPLFGGGVSSVGHVTGGGTLPPIPGMSSGGSGRFGGRAGIDKNLLSLNGSPILRVSRGEHFQVAPANSNGGLVRIVPSPYFDAVVDGRAAKVAAPMAGQAAMMGAAGGSASVMRRQSRMLP